MSICAMLIMGVLFFSETAAFVSTKIATSITLDENTQPQIRLNFNITLTDLQCDFVSLDVLIVDVCFGFLVCSRRIL